jgi:hypothetical protein
MSVRANELWNNYVQAYEHMCLIVTIRNHAYQKLFPFVVTRPSLLLPLLPTRISDRYVVKLHFSELPPIVWYDI